MSRCDDVFRIDEGSAAPDCGFALASIIFQEHQPRVVMQYIRTRLNSTFLIYKETNLI